MPKLKLTDGERHKRFLAMAIEVEASNDSKAFDKAFEQVMAHPPKKAQKPEPR
jgi:hypothetical protein